MKRVSVFRKDGSLGWQAEWADDSSAQAWITAQKLNKSWGRDQRDIRADDPAIGQEDITKAIATTDVILQDGSTVKQYTFAAEFTISIDDITAEVAQRKTDSDRRDAAKAALKALKKSDIKTVGDAVDALLKIVDVLHLNE